MLAELRGAKPGALELSVIFSVLKQHEIASVLGALPGTHISPVSSHAIAQMISLKAQSMESFQLGNVAG